MRGCLFTLALGAVVIAGLVVFALPRVTEGLIATTLTAGGLRAQRTDVSVTTASPLDLLRMHADRVTIRATGAEVGDLAAERLELELRDVDLAARTAGSLAGVLDEASTTTPDGPLAIPSITFEGDTARVTAVASVDGPSVERLIAERVAGASGRPARAVELTEPNGLTIELAGTTVPGTLEVDEAGALRMTLFGPLSLGVELLAPGATPLALRDVRVVAGDLVLEGELAPAALFG